MKRLAAFLCLLGPVGAAPAQDAAKPNKSPLLDRGVFQNVRKPLEHIFPFTFQGAALKVDRQAWARGVGEVVNGRPFRNPFKDSPPIVSLFYQIQGAAGPAGGSAGGGGNSWQITFQGQNLNGQLAVRGDAVRMSLEESNAPARSLQFNDDGQGAFTIQVMHPEQDVILLRQVRNSGFTVVALVDGRMIVGQGESFLAVFRKHRKDMESHVLPVLEHFGIRLMLSPSAPEVRRAVLALVTRTPETLAEAKQLLADLDSGKFRERERASRLLNDRYEVYKDVIQQRLESKDLTLEARTRLQQIAAKHPDSERVGQTVAALELMKDARYLVSLLEHARAEEVPGVIRHLEKTTGQKLGADPAAWREWAAKKGG
jgi:hypothetical protein